MGEKLKKRKKAQIEHIEVDVENGTIKKIRGKDWLVNRLLAGGGIILLGFTLFYASVFADFMEKRQNAPESTTETTEVVQQETEPVTEAPLNENLFQSPYADTDISEDMKNSINGYAVGESVVTGIAGVDNKISSFHFSTIDAQMSQYEKLKNAYDYMLKNFGLKEKDNLDEEHLQELSAQQGLQSVYDMEFAYRAERLIGNFTGTAEDFAAAYALLLRKLGFDAYYVGVEGSENADAYGYAVLKSNGSYYIFDPASELAQMERTEATAPDYSFFGIKQTAGQEAYQIGDILATVTEYKGFEVLPPLNFEVMFSNGSNSVFGEVEYEGSGSSATAKGELDVYMGDTVNMAGTVNSTGGKNQWKLSAVIYDKYNNYINEYEIYKDSTASAYNETSFHTTEGGYIKLKYSVTDMYGRTCTVNHTFKIHSSGNDQVYEEPQEPDEEENSQEESSQSEETKKQN